MNKNELVEQIAQAADIAKGKAALALDAFVAAVSAPLKKGQDVSLVGFATVTGSERAARTGRNPQTGAEIKIEASNVPKFRAGKKLKDAVN